VEIGEDCLVLLGAVAVVGEVAAVAAVDGKEIEFDAM